MVCRRGGNSVIHLALVVVCGAHILLRRYRQPEARMAWLVILIAPPIVGALGYLLFGLTNIGKARIARLRDIGDILPRPERADNWPEGARSATSEQFEPLFNVGRSISGYLAVGGNRADLMEDPDAAIAKIVEDIDHATIRSTFSSTFGWTILFPRSRQRCVLRLTAEWTRLLSFPPATTISLSRQPAGAITKAC